jgi:FtsZ-interacting cell division protein ZipA
MNELQISLLAVGAVVVAGVYGFNRWQERKYRRQTESAFAAEHEDVLLKERSDHAPRKVDDWGDADFREEPTIAAVDLAIDEDVPLEDVPLEVVEVAEPALATMEETPVAVPMAESHPGVLADESINYVATIVGAEPLAGQAVAEALAQARDPGRSAHLLGLNVVTGQWEEIDGRGNAAYAKLVASLLLADRSGPVSAEVLTGFCETVQAMADGLGCMAEFPDIGAALARAAELDSFCADVDVLIGINVASANGQGFPATKIRALAEAAGMRLDGDGGFHLLDDTGALQYSLTNIDPLRFSPDTIKHMSIHGVTLLFDVPKVRGGLRVFGQMVMLAKHIATTLDARLVDDHRRPLSDAGIDQIKQQLTQIYAQMKSHGIPAGSPQAQRLFS